MQCNPTQRAQRDAASATLPFGPFLRSFICIHMPSTRPSHPHRPHHLITLITHLTLALTHHHHSPLQMSTTTSLVSSILAASTQTALTTPPTTNSSTDSSSDASTGDDEVLGTSSQAIIACNSISVAACVLVLALYVVLHRKHARLMQRTSLILSCAMAASDLILHVRRLLRRKPCFRLAPSARFHRPEPRNPLRHPPLVPRRRSRSPDRRLRAPCFSLSLY